MSKEVQTDGLVCEMCDEPASCPSENCAFRVNAADRIEALQRSEAEKDEALEDAQAVLRSFQGIERGKGWDDELDRLAEVLVTISKALHPKGTGK